MVTHTVDAPVAVEPRKVDGDGQELALRGGDLRGRQDRHDPHRHAGLVAVEGLDVPGQGPHQPPDPARRFAELVALELAGKLTATQTKTVLADMIDTGDAPADIAARNGFEAMDTGALKSVVDGLIADNPAEWQRFCDGDGKVTGFFVGQVMKATQGKADGKAVTALINARKG